ncbi:hypothetical protein, partial [Cypionkella sp.]|uniref:hypothetical protein n=1 Tax=Cypionkella sp. TaxID=2811411 RepID=UPI002ABCB931
HWPGWLDRCELNQEPPAGASSPLRRRCHGKDDRFGAAWIWQRRSKRLDAAADGSWWQVRKLGQFKPKIKKV